MLMSLVVILKPVCSSLRLLRGVEELVQLVTVGLQFVIQHGKPTEGSNGALECFQIVK